MATQQPLQNGSPGGGVTGNGTGNSTYKRASRKGAPRRFSCEHPGCTKLYSRAEHLQRHQLNHNPKEIFRCDVAGCDQKFVRADLLSRHKRRHSAAYMPRNRVPSFTASAAPAPRPEPLSFARSSVATSPSSGPVAVQSLQPHQPHQSHPPQQPHMSHRSQPSHQPHTAHHPVHHPHQSHQSHPGHPGHPAHHPHHTAQQSHQGHQSQPRQPYPGPPPSSGPHDAAILLTPESNAAPTPKAHPISNPPPPPLNGPPHSQAARAAQAPPWQPMDEMAIIRPKPGYYSREQASLPEAPPMVPYADLPFQDGDNASRDNFAVWLFDPQTSFSDFSVTNIPFLEGGLESTLNSNLHYDYESLTSRSQLDPTPPRQVEFSDEWINEHRRQEVLRWFQSFRERQPKYEPLIANLVHDSGGDLPALSLDMMSDCLQEYWEKVSPRMPIVHQPTFSCNRCSVFLLMVMIALGAASLRSRDLSGNLSEYGGFADVIISTVRWEILTAEDASPPVGLSVAQSLLLLEFYEKMYSSRKFHERAHIYHSATLTLLRRGSPLIGRAGSESPPEEPAPTSGDQPHGMGLDSRTWWIRWAETESMHRVVFAAFMMDIIHAAMFGHAADMAPHEIRLPLPCDDSLWNASSPDLVRQLDGNLRMYGVKQVSFLDGLKSALHGKEVKTHSFGRMIIMSGLLSVGWHLSHRETHLRWLDLRTPSMETHGNWKKILLRAFDDWKESFDHAMGTADPSADPLGQRGCANGPIQSASVLYHLAHVSLHVDIIDCQVYAGAKRLLGRKVSTRDYTNAQVRMRSWSHTAPTRHAVLHAFKLLYRVLINPHPPKKRGGGYVKVEPNPPYSIRTEPDPHRPWIMYYAALCIWSFVHALGPSSAAILPPPQQPHERLVAYLSRVAELDELSDDVARGLGDGLPVLLDVLKTSLSGAYSELLQEACERLKLCRDMTIAGGGG